MQVEAKKGQPVTAQGLEGIKVANSEICLIDGARGVLLYRGYNIHDLAPDCSFEEVAYLLWNGELPTRAQLDALRSELAASRELPGPVLEFVAGLPRNVLPMAALRTGVSLLGVLDAQSEDMSPEANRRKSVRLTAQIAGLIAAIERHRQGKPFVPPDAALSHAANFLYMLNGRKPSDVEARTMDTVLLLHAEHGFNASTFTARVICSTLADLHSAVVGAIGSLKGPLHGGAGVGVLDAMAALDSVADVRDYVVGKLNRKEKIMGFGHRVYKVEDPRAVHLREFAGRLGAGAGDTKWYDMAVEMENVVKEEKGISVNVDFYSAIVQRYLGVPKELFTCTFTASRIVGWTAHCMEQYCDNRLIRPLCEYVGPREREFVSLERRA